ncbi:MAG: PRC-barrel domain-containing protein [Proteobacteria bacterium]|nr:PRC-barrel domain-containing protein [Pseudomonadota bacterium]
MTDRNDSGFGLVRLSDTEFILEDQTQDLRGLDVYDSGGEKIGTVEHLYVHEEENEVRFLGVAAGGFLRPAPGSRIRRWRNRPWWAGLARLRS